MPDLAQTPTRHQALDRATKNTDYVLPRARVTEAAAPQVRADLRNAYRASNAESIRRTLGMVTDGVAAVVDLSQQRHFEQEKAQAQQAMQDQATGVLNPEAAKKSAAYAQVIATGTARGIASDIEAQAHDKVNALLAGGEHDLTDVNQTLDETFKPALFEADGKPKNYGTPEANAALYRALNDVRVKLHAGAQEVIATQVRAKGLNSLVDVVALDAKKGVLNVEDAIHNAGMLGVTPQAAKTEFSQAIVNAAIQTDNPDLLLHAADSRKADGTRTWSAAEENSLRDQAITLRNIVERKHEKEAADRSAATLGHYAVAVHQGVKISAATVQAQIDSGALRPQDAQMLFSVQEHHDDEARQKLMQGRQDQSYAESRQDRAMALQDRAEARSDRQSARAATGILVELYTRGMSGPQNQRAITALYAGRKIDGNTYLALQKEVASMPSDSSMVEKAGAKDYEFVMRDVFSTGRSVAGTPGNASVADFNTRADAGQLSFYRSLRQGRTPAESLRAGLYAAGLTDRFVNATLVQAQARDQAPSFTDMKKK